MELAQGSEVMLHRESDSRGLFSSAETSDHDCDMGASCEDVCDVVCLCHTAPCTLYPEAHMPTPDTLMCNSCGKNRVVMTQYSEGYGTEEECLLSDPQGESDADADIEDTDCRLQEPGSLQRISSRRRKRPRLARQDTTESEDDGGGRSHRSHRWNLRPSPPRAHSRTIPEESISQVRPLVICRPSTEVQISSLHRPLVARRLTSLLPSSVPIALVLLLSLPLSLSLLLLLLSFLGPRADT